VQTNFVCGTGPCSSNLHREICYTPKIWQKYEDLDGRHYWYKPSSKPLASTPSRYSAAVRTILFGRHCMVHLGENLCYAERWHWIQDRYLKVCRASGKISRWDQSSRTDNEVHDIRVLSSIENDENDNWFATLVYNVRACVYLTSCKNLHCFFTCSRTPNAPTTRFDVDLGPGMREQFDCFMKASIALQIWWRQLLCQRSAWYYLQKVLKEQSSYARQGCRKELLRAC
jgi:hypothetical protein